jgi:hypothetical protein
VDRVGRGLPRSVACGKEYTLVATYPYEGPSEEVRLLAFSLAVNPRSHGPRLPTPPPPPSPPPQVAKKLTEEHKLRLEEQRLQEEEEERRRRKDLRRMAKNKRKEDELQFLTGKRLCTLDPNCPGFQVHALKPNICKECGFSSAYHTIVVEEDDGKGRDGKPGDVLDKGMGTKAKGGHQITERKADESAGDEHHAKSQDPSKFGSH